MSNCPKCGFHGGFLIGEHEIYCYECGHRYSIFHNIKINYGNDFIIEKGWEKEWKKKK